MDQEGTNRPIGRHWADREVKEPLQTFFISPLFSGHLQGTTVKAKMLHGLAPVQSFNPAMLLSLEEDALQRVKRCY